MMVEEMSAAILVGNGDLGSEQPSGSNVPEFSKKGKKERQKTVCYVELYVQSWQVQSRLGLQPQAFAPGQVSRPDPRLCVRFEVLYRYIRIIMDVEVSI